MYSYRNNSFDTMCCIKMCFNRYVVKMNIHINLIQYLIENKV